MNQKNLLGLDRCFMNQDNPLELFKSWMIEAKKKEINDPTAFSLATSDSTGKPNIRMVLLKGVSVKGFVFYTNLNSLKSKELKENPKAALCFHWKSIRRQIRVLGTVKKVEDNEADLYFESRSYESKISAWSSEQSNVMKEKNEILRRIEYYKKKYSKKVPRPPHWSGWILDPSCIEFWLRGDNRIHERLRYAKSYKLWKKEILYP